MPKPEPKPLDLTNLRAIAEGVVKADRFPVLATMEEDQPRLRPVSPVLTEGFTVYVANLKSYDKTEQLARNPKVELCYMDEDHNQVRITGVAGVLDNRPLLEEIWRKNKLLMHYLGSIDNPELIVYKIIPQAVRFMQEWALEYHDVPLDE